MFEYEAIERLSMIASNERKYSSELKTSDVREFEEYRMLTRMFLSTTKTKAGEFGVTKLLFAYESGIPVDDIILA